MWYVVELTKNNKIGYDFDLEEIGERKRKEYIEMQEYLLSLEDEQ